MSASVHGSDRVDQVKTQDGGHASRTRLKRTWRAGRSRTAVTRVEWRGKHMEYATRGGFRRFGPQNPAKVPRNGQHVVASRS